MARDYGYLRKDTIMDDTATKVETQELREKLDALNQSFRDVTRTLKDKMVGGTKEWATQHPGATLGIVAGVAGTLGLVVGLLLSRSRD
jgi:ElaB/YqjD/DUF883 family membrane-anchored ribosome-binding protein